MQLMNVYFVHPRNDASSVDLTVFTTLLRPLSAYFIPSFASISLSSVRSFILNTRKLGFRIITTLTTASATTIGSMISTIDTTYSATGFG